MSEVAIAVTSMIPAAEEGRVLAVAMVEVRVGSMWVASGPWRVVRNNARGALLVYPPARRSNAAWVPCVMFDEATTRAVEEAVRAAYAEMDAATKETA